MPTTGLHWNCHVASQFPRFPNKHLSCRPRCCPAFNDIHTIEIVAGWHCDLGKNLRFMEMFYYGWSSCLMLRTQMIITLTLNFVKTTASSDVEASKWQHHRLLGIFASLLLHTWRPGRFNFPNRWSHRITVQAILALKVMDFPIPISSIRRSKLPRRCPVPESVWSSSDVLVLQRAEQGNRGKPGKKCFLKLNAGAMERGLYVPQSLRSRSAHHANAEERRESPAQKLNHDLHCVKYDQLVLGNGSFPALQPKCTTRFTRPLEPNWNICSIVLCIPMRLQQQVHTFMRQ